MASIQQRGEVWVVRWREGGRGSPHRQITVSTERRAQALAEEIERQIELTGRYEPRQAGRSSDLAVILADYLADVARRRQPSTVRLYARTLEVWRRWAGPVQAHEVLSFQRLAEYHAHLQAPETGRHLHGRGPGTIHKHIGLIELVWRWAWQRQARGTYHGIPQPDSLELEPRPAPHKIAPTWEEMDSAIAAAQGWQRDLYVVLRCTGLRVQQALELRWEDVDLSRGLLRVRPELGKSRQERRGRLIPIAPVLIAELSGWERTGDHLLECERNQRVARARDAARAWTRAGVDPQVWRGCAHHAFRAGFVSGLKRAGADTEAVEHLVGHSRGSVRERYADSVSLPLVDAVRLVPVFASCTQPAE